MHYIINNNLYCLKSRIHVGKNRMGKKDIIENRMKRTCRIENMNGDLFYPSYLANFLFYSVFCIFYSVSYLSCKLSKIKNRRTADKVGG